MTEEPADAQPDPEPAKIEDEVIVRPMDVDRASLRRVNPASSGHTAVVYLTRRGTYELATSKLTMGELWLDTPSEMYSVDLTPHNDVFTLELPSLEEAFRFPTTVHVTWRVSDPIVAVRTRLAKPLPQIKPYLEERLRAVTRRYPLNENAKAEREINASYQDKPIVMSAAILIERCAVLIDPETGARDHLMGLRATEHERQLNLLREQNELALKKQRMEMYADALRTDNHNMLALILAGHGEDAKAVVELVLQQQETQGAKAREVLEMLLSQNLINRHDVRGIVQDAATTVSAQIIDAKPLATDRPVAVGEKPPPAHITSHRLDADEDDDDDEVEDDDDR